jgi:hypothetical protein
MVEDEAGLSIQIQALDTGRARAGVAMLRNVATLGSFACGAFLLSFDLGWIPGLTNQSGEVGAAVVGFFAVLLFGFGVFAWLLFARFVNRCASRIVVTSSGIVATLFSGAAVDLLWSDPKFEVQVTVFTDSPTSSAFFSGNGSQGRITGRVTREGLALVIEEARRHGLLVDQRAPEKAGPLVVVTTIKHRSEGPSAVPS